MNLNDNLYITCPVCYGNGYEELLDEDNDILIIYCNYCDSFGKVPYWYEI